MGRPCAARRRFGGCRRRSRPLGTPAAGEGPRSGREFLQAKVDQRQAARRAAEETSQAVRALMTALSDVADDVSDRTEALTGRRAEVRGAARCGVSSSPEPPNRASSRLRGTWRSRWLIADSVSA